MTARWFVSLLVAMLAVAQVSGQTSTTTTARPPPTTTTPAPNITSSTTANNCMCLSAGGPDGTAAWCLCCELNCLGVQSMCFSKGFCSTHCANTPFCVARNNTTSTTSTTTSTTTTLASTTTTSTTQVSTTTLMNSTTTTSSLPTTTTMLPSSYSVLTLSNSSAIDVEFASGDVSLQVPGSVYSAGVRRIVVGAGVRGRDVNATDVVRPFASFVSLQVEPAGAGIGATPLQLCLTTALFNGRLCWAVNDYEERGWFCTNVTTFLKDLKTCARIDALPTDGTPRAFTLLAPADLMPGTSTSRTLPDGRNVTTTNASMTNTTVICVVGNQEGGVLCDIDAGARDAWEQFLELGDAVVGVVIAAIVLCVICCYVLIIYLQTRGSSRKGDDEAPPPQAQRGATDEMASVSPPVYEMTESSSSSRGGKRAKKREKERARERIASEPPRSARRQKDDDEESSSSDNYNKFERRLDVYESSSESASEHVIVMQTIEVAETPVAMESSGKKSRPTKDIKPAPKKRTKKKKKPAIPNDLDEPAPPPAASSLSSSSDDGDLKWSRVEKVKN